MLNVPLPDERGLRGDGRPHVRRFRSHRLALGERLATLRTRYWATQAEIARAIGAGDHSAVGQWGSGVNGPEGMLRERRRGSSTGGGGRRAGGAARRGR